MPRFGSVWPLSGVWGLDEEDPLEESLEEPPEAVSYTHLTLPTKLEV